MQKHKLIVLSEILSETLNINISDDELFFAGIAIARFVCAKELRENQLLDKTETANE